jgi:hypothetical protein
LRQLFKCALSCGIGSLLSATIVVAQAAPATPPPVRFRTTADASGTLLYGSASQRIFSASIGTLRTDKQFELRFDGLSAYGDSRDATTGVRSVTVRNSRVSSSLDWHPQARVSPFAFGSAESSFQQRFASRVSAGAGAKLTFWRPDSVVGGFVQDASISLAVLDEQTRALRNATPAEEAAAGGRARWSLRARFSKRINQNIRFSHSTMYQPAIDHPDHYTLEALTELAVPLSNLLQLTISHREKLDSEAKARGATSIRDGQLLFGLRATF